MTENNLKSSKRTALAYNIFTGLFALFMIFSCMSDLFQVKQAVSIMTHLGFPLYLMRFIGVAKLIGLLVLVIPRFSRISEWAYAGYFFNLSGGLYAHLCLKDPPTEWTRPLFFLILLTGSYIFYRKKSRSHPVKRRSDPFSFTA